jgi:hypothetical protein
VKLDKTLSHNGERRRQTINNSPVPPPKGWPEQSEPRREETLRDRYPDTGPRLGERKPR